MYAEDKSDLLMRSLIENYALEGRGDDGKPTGKFYMDYKGMYKVGEEVVRSHFGYTEDQNRRFLIDRLSKIIDHVDVLKKGYLAVEEVPAALKTLLGEVEINNELQM